MANKYVNTASTATLAASITSAATTVDVSGYTGWPSATPFWAEIARGTVSAEVVQVTGVAAGTLTIVRGQDGTTASAHNAGDTIEHVVPAYLPNLAEQHAEATTAHGTSSALVGTDDTGTLTNKTYRGAHTHTYTDANPAAVAAGFEVNADSTALRDGFVHNNTGGDPDRAAFRSTQSGADRVVAFNDGTVKITPAGTATRPGLENDGTTQLDAAVTVNSTLDVTGNTTFGGTLSVTGATTVDDTVTADRIDLPTPAPTDTTPRITARTQAGQDALSVIDSASTIRARVDDNGDIHLFNATGTKVAILSSQANPVHVIGAVYEAMVDGTVKVVSPASYPSAISQLWPFRLDITGEGGHLGRIQTNSDGTVMLEPVDGTAVMVRKKLAAEDPNAALTVETWHTLTLQNGWSTRAGYYAPACKLTPDGRVWLRGGLTGGTFTNGTIIATLPAGYRPAASVSMPLSNNTTSGSGSGNPRLFVRTSGNIEIWLVGGDFHIDGCSFSID